MTRPRDKAATAGVGHTPGTWEVRPASYGHDIMAVPALVDGLYDGPLLWVASVTKSVGATTRGQFYPAHAVCDANARLIAAAPATQAALQVLLEHYLSLANSGDAGFWDPEAEPEVIAARAALSLTTPPSQAPDATGGRQP